ncbi:GAF domain-containing protein [Streptomyces sviceus]|uniref:GAF domain-containing protein n=1 Tax=Streptomyces sviceus TaxID=285530 RepID=UPI003CC83B8E
MKEQLMARTFVELADSLVADFDLMDFLRLLTDRCVDLLDASAAGVLLADRDGVLRVMAASDERVRLLELFQLQNHEGPCLDCFHTGITVSVPDLRDEAARWPLFTAQAQRIGFTAVQALPMRLRDEVVGALNLFPHQPGAHQPPPPPPSHRPSPTSPPSACCNNAPPSAARSSTNSCRPPSTAAS